MQQQKYIDRCHEYAVKVSKGEILAGPYVRAECKRFLNDLKHGKKRGIFYLPDHSRYVFEFFERYCTLNTGDFCGKPFNLLLFQCFILGNLFGWFMQDSQDAEKMVRRFRRAYVEIGKGNGKSPLAAGIGMYFLTAEAPPNGEIYIGASKFEQAKIIFRDAKAMVQNSPYFSAICTVTGGELSPQITNISKDAGTKMKPVTGEKKMSGFRPSAVLCDELHEHQSADLIENLELGFKQERNPLMFMITNSGSDPNSICGLENKNARKIAECVTQNDRQFNFVCSLDKKDDPFADESCWIKANPALGVCITHDYIRAEVEKAKGMLSKRNRILRLNFCKWTDAENAWIEKETWLACEYDMSLDDYKGLPCVLSLDLSYRNDLTALTAVFPFSDYKEFDSFTEFWKPKKLLIAHSERDNVPYDVWHNQGFLHASPDEEISMRHLSHRLAWFRKHFDVKLLVYDEFRMRELKQELDEIGLEFKFLAHPQGFRKNKDSELWMPSSVEKLESAITTKAIRINHNPVLRYNAACTVIRDDPSGVGNRCFAKDKSTSRIDGIVSMAMGVGAASMLPHLVKQSVYQHRGAIMM